MVEDDESNVWLSAPEISLSGVFLFNLKRKKD
jgi:hypothetical protein